MRWKVASQTHPGTHRKTNEDAVLTHPQLSLWAVADGMGGHDAGDVASEMVTHALGAAQECDSLTDLVDHVDDLLVDVNDKLRQHADEHCQGRPMGTTVVAMVTQDDVGVVLWAGDSRLYRLRDGNLEQVTRDHNPIADLLDEGLITESTALNSDTNVITRAVGGQRDLVLDIAVFDVRPNDTFLLCSDGLYRELDERDITYGMSKRSIADGARSLLDTCLERGARDNVSVVLSRQTEA